MWMRVDGADPLSPQGMSALAFDNMGNRPVTGTTNWTKYEIVLDVRADAVNLAYGILLSAEGSVWVTGVRLDVVDPTTAPTGL